MSFLLLRLFILFFADDGEITGTPATLIATVIAFGKIENKFVSYKILHLIYVYVHFLSFKFFSVLNLSFALSIMGFLIMHIMLVLTNKTTIEVISFANISHMLVKI